MTTVTSSEVLKLLHSSPQKSSNLDFIPTSLIKIGFFHFLTTHSSSRVFRICFFHLRRLRSSPHDLSALVISRLDYCNSMLAHLPASTLAPLQRVINAAARVVADLGPRDHVTLTLYQLHWLPIAERIKFKRCLLVHHVINGRAPSWRCWSPPWPTSQFALLIRMSPPQHISKQAVPQCSVSSWADSVLILHLPHLIRHQSVQMIVDQQQYADDTQVFISLSKSNSLGRVSRLETALVHLTSWFYHNGLVLNPEKSEAILLGAHPLNKSLNNIT